MNTSQPQQLLLGVKLDDDATFDNFFGSAINQQLLTLIQNRNSLQQEKLLVLWGSKSSGKSHLLQSLCQVNAATESPSIYLPLKECRNMGPEILAGLENLPLICLDDIDNVVGRADWEQAFFTLLNSATESGSVVVLSCALPPPQLQVALPDLASRLQAGMVYQLHSLNDEDKAAMFKQRAGRLGIELADPVVDYIMQRSNRDVSALITLLHQLDRKSLEQKRRITIPLVKQCMGW